MVEHVFINKSDLTPEQEEELIIKILTYERPSDIVQHVKQYAVDLESSIYYYYTLDYMVEIGGWVRAKTFEEFEQLILEYQLTH